MFITCRMEDYKYLFKIVLVGEAGVGKTCLVRRFTQVKTTYCILQISVCRYFLGLFYSQYWVMKIVSFFPIPRKIFTIESKKK